MEGSILSGRGGHQTHSPGPEVVVIPSDFTRSRYSLSRTNFPGSHTYAAEGTFNITCFVENPWAEAVGFYEVIVQEAIVELLFEPEVAVKGEGERRAGGVSPEWSSQFLKEFWSRF